MVLDGRGDDGVCCIRMQHYKQVDFSPRNAISKVVWRFAAAARDFRVSSN